MTFCKKEVKDELEILRKEENETASGSVLAGKVAGNAPTAPTLASSTAQPLPMVVATKASVPRLGEPTISEEQARHKKRQKGSEGETRPSDGSSLVWPGSYSISFQDPEFWSNLFIDAYLDPLSERRLFDLRQPAAFHQVERQVLQLTTDCRLLKAGTVTWLTKMKADYKEKLDRARESVKGEVMKAVEATTAETKK